MTYARPHAGFFHTDRSAAVSATHVGAAAHNVDGDIVNCTYFSRYLLPLYRPQCGQ